MKKMVLKVTIDNEKSKRKALKVVAAVEGVDSVAVDMEENKITVIGKADPVSVTTKLRKYGFGFTDLLSVEAEIPTEEEKNEGENNDAEEAEIPTVLYVQRPYYHVQRPYYYDYNYVSDENPNACTIC